MGKSLGNVLEPRSLLKAYGADAVRFYFLKEIVFGQVLGPTRAAFQHCPMPRQTGQCHVFSIQCDMRVQGYHTSAYGGSSKCVWTLMIAWRYRQLCRHPT